MSTTLDGTPMFTLIEGGDVYDPDPLGRTSLLVADGTIAQMGDVDGRALAALECEVVDASGTLVVPGLFDPHQHLLGGSGEEGFSSQSPQIHSGEIVRWGITSVVGVLGVDTTMKTLPGLLARVKALKEEGLNAYMWTGGYNVPPTSMMDSVREDIMFIEEVIGVGEVAISDLRGMDPPVSDLARVAKDAYIGGMLARKSGLTHIHVGDRPEKLRPLREVLEGFNVEPCWFYATHVERSEALMREAITLARKGMAVDVDVMEEDLPRWLKFYLDNGGPPDRLTISSDAAISSPRQLFEQARACIRKHGFPVEQVLALATRNPASILKLPNKGTLETGKAADVLVLEKGTFDIVHVMSKGRWVVRDGEVVAEPKFLEQSKREIHLVGEER